MTTPRYVLPVALLLALAGGAGLAWRMLRGQSKPADSQKRTVATAVAAPDRPAPTGPPLVRRFPESEAGGDDAIATKSPPSFPATRRSGAFVVEVVDNLGAPVTATEVKIDSWIGGHFGDLAIADDRDFHRRLRADGGGRVAIAELAEGAYSVTARADDGRSARQYFDYSLAQADLPLRVTLSEEPQRPPGIEITVVARDGAAVADAEVELFGASLDRGLVGPPSHPTLQAHSDGNGVARFDGVRWVAGMAIAKAPDGRVGAVAFGEEAPDPRIEADPDLQGLFGSHVQPTISNPEEFLESLNEHSQGDDFDTLTFRHLTSEDFVSAKLVVSAPGGIAGSIEVAPDAADPDGALAGASIEAWLATFQVPWETSYGRGTTVPVEGRKFVVDGLPAGRYPLVLHAPRGARLVLARANESGNALENSVDPPLTEVDEGATMQVTLHATIGGTIHGHVHLPDGSPVVGARVVATFGPWRFEPGDAFVRHQMHVWSFGPDSGLESLHPLTHVVGRTDARGEYRLTGLQPGFQRIMVTARGLCFDRRDWTKVADGQVVELEHDLEAAGALQGIAPGSAYLGVTRVGAQRPDALATLLGGRSFTIGGLRPGTYVLADFAEERTAPPVERGRATVEAGRTTFVDLTDAPGPVEIAGQVVDAHGGVPSAVVEFNSVRRHVDGAGSFVFHSGLPIEDQFEISVETDQWRETFQFPIDPRSGGWRGSMRLGDESRRIEVRDEQKSPVAGWVKLRRSATNPFEIGSNRFRSKPLALDSNGSLTIERLSAGQYELRVSAPGGIELSTKVAVPHADVLQIELAETGSVVVWLVDVEGSPMTCWNVSVCTYLREGAIPEDSSRHDEWFDTKTAVAGGDGVAHFDHVRSGRIVVKAEGLPVFGLDDIATGSVAKLPPAPRPVQIELRPGETKEVELRVPAREGGDR